MSKNTPWNIDFSFSMNALPMSSVFFREWHINLDDYIKNFLFYFFDVCLNVLERVKRFGRLDFLDFL